LQQEIDGLRNENKNLKAENGSFLEKNVQMRVTIDDQSEEIKTLDDLVNELRFPKDKTEKELDHAIEKNKDLEDKIAVLSEQVEDLGNQSKGLKDAVNRIK